MNTPFDSPYEKEIVPGLRREWMLLVRRRWLIIGIAAVALLGALTYNLGVRPLFTGLAIVSAGESIPSQPYVRLNLDVPRLRQVIDKEIARITSRELLSSVAERLTEAQKTELARGPLGPWYSRLRFGMKPAAQGEKAPSKAELVTALRSRLRVRWRDPSTWIDIQVDGDDGEAVAEFANDVAKLYVAETAAANQGALNEVRTSIDSELETKQEQLGKQLSGLRELGSESGLGDLPARRAILERQVRAFQDALVAAQMARVGTAATSREAAQIDNGALVAANDARVVAAQARVSDLEDRERALLATLGDQHPEVVTIREQLKTARDRLAAAHVAIEKTADSTYTLAVKEEARLQANLQRVQKELASLDRGSLGYSIEQKKADASRLAVDQMIKRREDSAVIVIEAELIQTASPSSVPSSPKKRENVSYALLAGLVVGLLIAWLIERFDDSIQSPDDIKDILGLPFLGMVPLVRKLNAGSLAAGLKDGKTGFADSLRVVRTNLMFGPAETRPKVIVFTSASPADGKSTVACGVALLLQETEGTVLLIDGDLRRPSVHTLLDVPAEPGLSNLLSDPPDKSKLPKLKTTKSPHAEIDVLAAGPPMTVSAARLGSEAMRNLVDQARKKYDWVIIDSPPALGLPDAGVLATMADAVVIVCSGDKTPRQALRSVTDQLNALGGKVVGVVLNRLNMERHSYYYGRHYSAYYGVEEKQTARP
ncbi:MAG: polysaccharide biosynthesis tyrosine autokinase [Vicinamibacteria bacterium]